MPLMTKLYLRASSLSLWSRSPWMEVAGKPSSHRFRHRKSACRFVFTKTRVLSFWSRPGSFRMLGDEAVLLDLP